MKTIDMIADMAADLDEYKNKRHPSDTIEYFGFEGDEVPISDVLCVAIDETRRAYICDTVKETKKAILDAVDLLSIAYQRVKEVENR